LKQIVGTKRLTYGTNFAGWDQSDEGNHGPIDPVLADNARRLLRRAEPLRA
jgi:aminocarboxymuconate-semialdehyde decarboxylase